MTTDIAGKKDSHADPAGRGGGRDDQEGAAAPKGGDDDLLRIERRPDGAEATVPEIRLAVAGPDLDIGNVETALEGLTDACYYLTAERNRYRFSLKENLNKRYADRRASIRDADIEARIKEEVQKVFIAHEGIDRRFFPRTAPRSRTHRRSRWRLSTRDGDQDDPNYRRA